VPATLSPFSKVAVEAVQKMRARLSSSIAKAVDRERRHVASQNLPLPQNLRIVLPSLDCRDWKIISTRSGGSLLRQHAEPSSPEVGLGRRPRSARNWSTIAEPAGVSKRIGLDHENPARRQRRLPPVATTLRKRIDQVVATNWLEQMVVPPLPAARTPGPNRRRPRRLPR